MRDVERPEAGRTAGRSGPPYVAASFSDLVEGLIDLGEIRRFDLRRARLTGARGVHVLAVLPEAGSIFLLVVVEPGDDGHRRFVEAGLGIAGDKRAGAHVRQARD